MTKARGPCGRAMRGWRKRRVKIVIRNAAVLPVPVCACPATSFPASDSGRTFSWMGVQCVKPAARIPSITGSGRSKLVKGRPSGWGLSVLTAWSLTGAPGESSGGRSPRSRTRSRLTARRGAWNKTRRHGRGRRVAAHHARIRGAAVRASPRTSAAARGAGGVGQQPARRARSVPHLRTPDQHRGGARDPAPSGAHGHDPSWTAMGLRDGAGPLDARAPRIPVLTGRAWSFADRLRAVDILPSSAAGLPPAECMHHLFADLDATLAARLEVGDVLVAGQQLGAGPGGVAAARALRAAGMLAVVAATYADGFDRALLDAGVPALAVDAPAVFHTGQRLRFNLEGGTIANLSSGDRQPIRNLTEAVLARLRDLLAS